MLCCRNFFLIYEATLVSRTHPPLNGAPLLLQQEKGGYNRRGFCRVRSPIGPVRPQSQRAL